MDPIDEYSYLPMLQESVELFLSQLQSGISDFSHFNLMFSRLIQSMASPPIEIIWFYSAVNFKFSYHRDRDYMVRILTLEQLFHSLVSLSAPSTTTSSSLNKVAVLAPLTFELYNLLFDLRFNLDKVIAMEIFVLVDRLMSFMSLCCCEGVDDDTLAFSPCFADLIRVWTVPRRRESGFEFEDDFKMFLPITTVEARNELLVGGTGTVRVASLAGIVMCQVFLIHLFLKFASEDSQEKLKKDLLNSAVTTITAFKSCFFFDTLLKILLESSLPVTCLLLEDFHADWILEF